MKLSIITINYNNAQGLKETIESVVGQEYTNFEYLIIDGNSTDASKDIIGLHVDKIAYWVSEPDTGIYDAMNKGIKKAKGEYVLLLNSGDRLYSNSVLQHVFGKVDKEYDLVFGNLHRLLADQTEDVVEMPEFLSIQHLLDGTLAHPCTFINRKLFDTIGLYRDDLKLVSDWAFFLQILAFTKFSYLHMPYIVATFKMDGLTSLDENQALLKAEREQVLEEYFSPELLHIIRHYHRYERFYKSPQATKLRQIKESVRKWMGRGN